ncbi:hypothetical protein GCM10009662_02200 [Catellatospora coxensis]|uniref:Uncharacterized protein n=1 Tax=Catellatospora coxensis TaxID=310354 RepID=A0A8J3KPI0_9ACTN|nr:hypothetical protein Cco03nite_03370 [Catellatospora coxensis]
MDPFAILGTGSGGGTWLVTDTNRQLTLHNRSGRPLFLALCGGRDTSSVGWRHLYDGQSHTVAIAVPRNGTETVYFYARTADGRWARGGVEKFYVAQPRGDDTVREGFTFQVRNARTLSPSLVAGAGELRVVGGEGIPMTGDVSYRIA